MSSTDLAVAESLSLSHMPVGTPAFFPSHHLIGQLWAMRGIGLRPQWLYGLFAGVMSVF